MWLFSIESRRSLKSEAAASVSLFLRSVLTRLEPCWANMRRCERPALTVLKFNRPHNSRHLITRGPQRASKDFLQTVMCVCVCEVYTCMWADSLHSLSSLQKGEGLTMLEKPKQPHLLPSVPFVFRLQSGRICLLYGSEPCIHVCVCVCLFAIRLLFCLPYGPSSPLIMDFWMTHTHMLTYVYCLEAQCMFT